MSSIESILWEERARRRLVRLCAAVSGDRDAAEDLAQETLLEAWRNAHKLRDPAGADRWLSAIARNVCRRWARNRSRDVVREERVAHEAAPAAGDLEEELDRTELTDVLDRALAALPPGTRDVLVQRYVHDAPHAEIAARLRVSEDAVSMRLSRGKAVLRRLVEPELGGGAPEEWHETRVWCSYCGHAKLKMRRDDGAGTVSFRCPRCNPKLAAEEAEFPLANPVFGRLVGDLVRPARILARVSEWTKSYYLDGLEAGRVSCTRCGAAARVERYSQEGTLAHGVHRLGLFVECRACGEQLSTSLNGSALALPQLRSFRREHPRTRALPNREVDYGGTPAVVVSFESVRGSSSADVVFAQETFRVLEVRAAA